MKKRDLFDEDFNSGYGVPINENIKHLARRDPDAFLIFILVLLNVHRKEEPFRPAGLATKEPWQQGEWHCPLTKLAEMSGWPKKTRYWRTRVAVDRLTDRWGLLETRLIYTVANTGATLEAHVTRATVFRVKNFHSFIKLQEGAPTKVSKQRSKQTPKHTRSTLEAHSDNTIGIEGKTAKTGTDEDGKRVSERDAAPLILLSEDRKVLLEELLAYHPSVKRPRGERDIRAIHTALAAYPDEDIRKIKPLHIAWLQSYQFGQQGGRFIPTLQQFLTDKRYRQKPPDMWHINRGGGGWDYPDRIEKKIQSLTAKDTSIPASPLTQPVPEVDPARRVKRVKEPY